MRFIFNDLHKPLLICLSYRSAESKFQTSSFKIRIIWRIDQQTLNCMCSLIVMVYSLTTIQKEISTTPKGNVPNLDDAPLVCADSGRTSFDTCQYDVGPSARSVYTV